MRLRALTAADLPWLRDLYATTRAEEMAAVPWPDAMKQQFLKQQFDLQHRHYLAHYGEGDFLAIEDIEQGPIGRCILLRQPPDHLLVDIAILPEWRGQGIGSALIRASQVDAGTLVRGLRLHVHTHNTAARRLYQRLGFAISDEGPMHCAMRWSPQESR